MHTSEDEVLNRNIYWARNKGYNVFKDKGINDRELAGQKIGGRTLQTDWRINGST